MLRGMEIRHLRYFVAVAEAGNVTRAAEACFVAQSALSQQLKRLESEVGASLFIRTSRGVELTPAGQLLLPLARRVIADEEQARLQVREYLGLERGRLRIGLIQTGGDAGDVVRSLAAFHAAHPAIELQIVSRPSQEMVQRVREGELDLAVVGFAPEEIADDLQSLTLTVDPFVAVLPAASAAGLPDPVDIADLPARGPILKFTAGTGMRRHVDEALERAGVSTSSLIEIAYAPDLLRFAVLGMGVALVPLSLARTSAGYLDSLGAAYRVLGLTDPSAVHPVTIVYDEDRVSAAGRAFVTALPGISKSDRI